MYASPEPAKQLVGQLTDADPGRFNWFILIEREGESQYRIITMEKPA